MAAREKNTTTPDGITTSQRMLSSCTGAVITSLIVTPLDVVKIRLQAQTRPMKPGSYFHYNNGLMDCVCVCKRKRPTNDCSTPWYSRQGCFTGTTDALVKIARREGITALWSGLSPTLLMAVPATIIYFTGYEQLKYALGYSESDPSKKHIPPIAGIFARVSVTIVTSPLEMIRTKLQSEQLTYGRLREALRGASSVGGVKSMFLGLGPTLLRDVPFSGLYWFGYEFLKAQKLKKRNETVPRFYDTFFAGGLAGGFAAFVTTPFDVVKTHRQIALGEVDLTKDKPKQMVSTFRAVVELFQRNGFLGVCAGVVPRVVKVAPACAIMISTFEYSKIVFSKYNAKRQSTV